MVFLWFWNIFFHGAFMVFPLFLRFSEGFPTFPIVFLSLATRFCNKQCVSTIYSYQVLLSLQPSAACNIERLTLRLQSRKQLFQLFWTPSRLLPSTNSGKLPAAPSTMADPSHTKSAGSQAPTGHSCHSHTLQESAYKWTHAAPSHASWCSTSVVPQP